MSTKLTKIEKINTAIKKTNAEFKKATKAQKRVLIAQDVLAQIKAKRYVAESGIWVQPNWSCKINASQIQVTDSVQKLFAEKAIDTCNVCALGGMFMSCTNLNNNTTVEQLEDDQAGLGEAIERGEKLSNGLNQIFSKKQLEFIEIYFENGGGWFGDYGFTGRSIGEDQNHVEAFYEKYPNHDDRLKEIMKNIVANNGTFVPSKLKVAKNK